MFVNEHGLQCNLKNFKGNSLKGDMMDNVAKHCSFCGTAQSPSTPLIAGAEGYICEACVRLANQVVTSWGRKRSLPGLQGPLAKPAELKQKLDQYIIGQDITKEILSVAVYNHYKRFMNDAQAKDIHESGDSVELAKSNILLIGPTGSGKTLLASTLARIVGVPFAVADATTLTQAGYVGDDVDTILTRLVDVADGNIAKAEWGIVYIDEVDKLARSSEGSTGVRDVSGEGVQQALLKLVEGTHVKLNNKAVRRETREETVVDTSNILFIVGGAFSGIEQIIQKRLSTDKNGIGFHTDFSHRDAQISPELLLEELRPEDLRRFGLIPEFIGRFPVITMLQELDEEALVKILLEPKNALIKQYQKLFSYDGLKLEFTDQALRQVARLALQRKTGARGLRGELEKLLRKTMFDAPSRQYTRCLVSVNDDAELMIALQLNEKENETRDAVSASL